MARYVRTCERTHLSFENKNDNGGITLAQPIKCQFKMGRPVEKQINMGEADIFSLCLVLPVHAYHLNRQRFMRYALSLTNAH